MKIPMIDLHCHLDLYPDPGRAAELCRVSGAYILSVTTTPSAWNGTSKLARGNGRIKTALGLHPQLAHERIGELALFDALLPSTRYVGEIGLDGSSEFKQHWQSQMRVFDHILASSARAGGRILSIHSRRSTTNVLDALARYPDAGMPILHWFSGTKPELRRAIDMGCWFSVGPAMMLGKRGHDLVATMPQERVITETDGPFATINGKPLDPGDVGRAQELLATCWGIERLDAAHIVRSSFRTLVETNVGGSVESS
jgi:TatD DNase family protein